MRSIDLFDNYLEGKLSGEESTEFEKQLAVDPTFANAFNEHKALLKALNNQAEKQALRNKLRAVHQAEFGNSKTISITRDETFARRHGKTIAVAASTALIAVLSTVAVLSTGGYLLKQQSNQITDLNRVVMELQASSTAIVEGITKNNRKPYAPANMEGSAFALNNKGYIITSYHMVNGADSIFIQNGNTERSLTKLVLTDPKLDLAILKIEDLELAKTWQVPFALKERSSDVGERVFTLGYPRKEMVYGEGSSFLSGYSNDTSMYQISVPVNPGNSGGPVLDEEGSIIGVIRGKISGAEATGFAIKANQIINSIQANAPDSTRQELLASGSKKGVLKKLKRSEQIKKINPYVFNVLVYKKD